VLETREDSPKDKLESDKPKEGFMQKEIGVPTDDEKVSIDSFPNASISLDTQIPDKQQGKVRPSEHNEEV
jgi:hypothetical protein